MPDLFNRIPPLARVPLRFGLIGGALGSVLVIILYYIGKHPLLIFPLFDFRVALFGIFMFFTLKELRDDHFGGLLFFWQGTIASGIFLVVYGIIASLMIWLFAINVPGFVIQYIELATNQIKNYPQEAIDQIGKDVFDRSLEQIKNITAGNLAALYFRQGLIIGFFISIILSVILRRQPKN